MTIGPIELIIIGALLFGAYTLVKFAMKVSTEFLEGYSEGRR